MSQGVTAASRNLKKLLDDPKIIFVVGGPAAGKRTQCEQIAHEFEFECLSMDDMMQAEAQKGSKLGERIKKAVKGGRDVPFDIIVQVLINGLIATPSKTKTYVINGFPQSLEQAVFFEKNVIEAHQILYYDIPEAQMVERSLLKAKTSGRRSDD